MGWGGEEEKEGWGEGGSSQGEKNTLLGSDLGVTDSKIHICILVPYS